MLLCDIGNTSFHFYDGVTHYKESVSTFDIDNVTQTVYYICVNPNVIDVLTCKTNWIDLKPFVDYSKLYSTLGVDRAIISSYFENAVVVDAGSAITVDVMRQGEYQGGFIYPGVYHMRQCYANISSKLDYEFSFELDLDKIAFNSKDAISYGYLAPFVKEVKAYDLPIILTGGDGVKFKQLFKEARVDELLIFKAMKKVIDVNGSPA
jgi:type III pantothenate kinase